MLHCSSGGGGAAVLEPLQLRFGGCWFGPNQAVLFERN